jgi:hypothetical protein
MPGLERYTLIHIKRLNQKLIYMIHWLVPSIREVNMRFVMYAVAVAALAIVFVSLPAQARQHHLYPLYAHGSSIDSGGWGSGPFWQGEPRDRRPIWRYGFYQGNDPDPFIRLQIMRDPTNGKLR